MQAFNITSFVIIASLLDVGIVNAFIFNAI